MARAPLVDLPTHRVTNQPPPLVGYDVMEGDAALREAVAREGADWAEPLLHRFGDAVGSRKYIEAGFLANEHHPRLRTFDRFGQRIDEVEFHPAYHQLMGLGMEYRLPSLPWAECRPPRWLQANAGNQRSPLVAAWQNERLGPPLPAPDPGPGAPLRDPTVSVQDVGQTHAKPCVAAAGPARDAGFRPDAPQPR